MGRGAERKRKASFLLCLVGPLALGVILNVLVRPGMARTFGGIQHSSGASVRGRDTWWAFDAATVEAHPLLTSFLNATNGAVGMWVLALCAILLGLRWAIIRFWCGSTSSP